MALKVWLPLDGNLENKGISNVSATNVGAVVNSVGKIGQSYKFETTGSYMTLPGSTVTDFKACSVTMWVNIISWNQAYATFLQIGKSSRPWDNYIFGILRDNSTSKICFALSNGSSSTQSNYETSNLSINTWYHLGFTYGNGKCAIYINGELYNEYTSSVLPDFTKVTDITIGKSNDKTAYQTNCLMNDLRIYDECLSPKQIKEISKSLISHYKLNGIDANENLCKGQMVAVNVSNLSYNYDTHTYTMTTAAGAGNNGLRFGTSNKILIPYGEFYRMSCEINPSITTTLVYDYNNYSNDTSQWNPSGNDNDLLSQRISVTATLPANTWTKIIMGSQNANANNTNHVTIYEDTRIGIKSSADSIITWQMRNVKVELGKDVTKWTPNKNDNLYKVLGYDKIIGKDYSGYGHNGTENGTLVSQSDTARYKGSTKFDGTSAYIALPALTTTGFADNFSIVWWSKIAEMNGKMAWGFTNGNRLNLYPTNSYFCCNTGDGSNNPYQDNSGNNISFAQYNGDWHQYAMVADGTNNKLYIDGEYKGKAKTYKGITGTQMYISGWKNDTQYKWNGGNMSDFRIYATALSDADVKELYQTSALIDNKNNMLAYEFIEE